MSLAGAAWSALTVEQAQAWRDYAESVFRSSDVTGRRYTGNALTEFVALATKFMQANPGGTVPVTPPTSSYIGDSVVVGTSAIETGVRWSASGPNDSETVTELLVQKMPSPRRKPTKQYTSAAFVQFAAGSLSFDLPLDPGSYALAYRFVRLATGQSTLLIPCGIVIVEEECQAAA
jgi:hypothetical protein